MRKKYAKSVLLGGVILSVPFINLSEEGIQPNLDVRAAVITQAYTDTQGVHYTIDTVKRTASAATYTGGAGADIVIPGTITVGGVIYLVTDVGASAFLNSGIRSVVLGENVINIGTSAFQTTSAQAAYYKQALTSVKFDQALQSIKTDAFAGGALSSIALPDGLKSIGIRAFANNFLTEINIGGSLDVLSDKAFQSNLIATVTFSPTSHATIGSQAFSGDPVSNLSLGENVIWVQDALNKLSPLYGNLLDLPITGLRLAKVIENGSVYKSWQFPLSLASSQASPSQIENASVFSLASSEVAVSSNSAGLDSRFSSAIPDGANLSSATAPSFSSGYTAASIVQPATESSAVDILTSQASSETSSSASSEASLPISSVSSGLGNSSASQILNSIAVEQNSEGSVEAPSTSSPTSEIDSQTAETSLVENPSSIAGFSLPKPNLEGEVVASAKSAAWTSNAGLPSTGEETNVLSIVGWGLLVLASFLPGKKKRKKPQI